MTEFINRREFLASVVAEAGLLMQRKALDTTRKFSLNYITASCMYGYSDLTLILPEVSKTGASALDIWPKVHGNQREQLDEMGEERFIRTLRKYGVLMGCITQYALEPFNLCDELRLAGRLGCRTIVTGGKGPKGLHGRELKHAVRDFLEKMKPQIDVAEDNGVKIAIENHSGSLIESAESLKWLFEFRPSEQIGIALAPYHLPQDGILIGDLIRELGNGIVMFYAWQYGMGSKKNYLKNRNCFKCPVGELWILNRCWRPCGILTTVAGRRYSCTPSRVGFLSWKLYRQ